MVISSFISSILVLALGVWAYLRLESSMNLFTEQQLLIESNKFSFKMWKDMPVTMYQSFTFFNLTNWNQVKSIGQKPRFVEVGPYVYKTIWSKSDVNFLDDEKLITFAEKKQWHFQQHLSHGYEEDLIWTINTPLMTALALIQNAPVITRNIVSVILDGLGEGAFIKRPIRSLLFEGYSDLIVSVGPLFDRRFANFNGKFAYLYNKNGTIDGHWTVSTGVDDLSSLNKITRFQSAIVNMTSFSSGQMPQGLNEVKAECAPAWSLDQSTNGQLFAPFNRDVEQQKLHKQLQAIKMRAANGKHQDTGTQSGQPTMPTAMNTRPSDSIVQAPKRFFSRISSSVSSATSSNSNQQYHYQTPHDTLQQQQQHHHNQNVQEKLVHLRDFGKYIFYPDLCRPIHLLPSKQIVTSDNGIEASRYFIDPRVFMNSTQIPTNKCFEMNPRPPLANALAATINSVTGANVNVPSLMTSASSPFALFIPPNNHHHHNEQGGGLFERANHPNSFINNALHSLSSTANQAADQLTSATNNSPISRLGRVRQIFSNIVAQRMSANPLLPSLAAGPAGLLMGSHYNNHHVPFLSASFHQPGATSGGLLNARNNVSPDQLASAYSNPLSRQSQPPLDTRLTGTSVDGNNPDSLIKRDPATNSLESVALQPNLEGSTLAALQQQHSMQQLPQQLQQSSNNVHTPATQTTITPGNSDRWITQFRFKWPRGVFSIGQCQLGAPIYVSLPHFLDADEYYLEQVDGLKPNRSLHEFYIDVESTLHSIPVGAKARLQLNVATPELRFRNIPNAMIPVLWQEVTFKMDKPIATMLYWSFTMSSTIYKVIAISLLCLGCSLLLYSFVGGFRRRSEIRQHSAGRSVRQASSSPSLSHMCEHERDRVSCASDSNQSDIQSSSSRLHRDPHYDRNGVICRQQEGRRSSWQHILLNEKNNPNLRQFQRSLMQSIQQKGITSDDMQIGSSLNQAFTGSCNEIRLDQDHHHKNALESRSTASSVSTSTAGQISSAIPTLHSSRPKYPSWSRASSHCELVSSFGTIKTNVNGVEDSCARCLLACLRHPPNRQQINVPCKRHHDNIVTGDIDSQLVRQNEHQLQSMSTTSSDIEKITLSSSSSSNLDSCSSINTNRKCKKSKVLKAIGNV